ncbi:MAG: lysophospholipase [Deltaproteobacteria bacterium]|nr:lysophospholipase [Deltaproteobacteria bacterium]
MQLNRTSGDLQENTGTFESVGGLEIFYRNYPAEDERARLVIVHGIGEHSGRYGNVFRKLVPRNISVWAMDLRGHGKSGGRRGHILAFDDYINDVSSMMDVARQGMQDQGKSFLLGHSMGGLIALAFALRYPARIDGVIVSSPSLGIAVKVPFLKKAVGKIMSYAVPGLTLSNGIDITMLSHDKEVVRAYADDPLVHDRVSARWFTEIVKTMEKLSNSASELKTPILMQLAGDDQLTDVNASKEFFGAITVDDKAMYVYERLYHEIYNESEERRAGPLQDLEEWVEAHL